jgi:hypothetical protein
MLRYGFSGAVAQVGPVDPGDFAQERIRDLDLPGRPRFARLPRRLYSLGNLRYLIAGAAVEDHFDRHFEGIVDPDFSEIGSPDLPRRIIGRKDPDFSALMMAPAYESSQLDGTVDAAQNNYILVYGDLKQYYCVDRVGATIELVPHLFGANRRPTGQRGLLLWFRTGGDLVNPDAVRVLNA